MPASLWNKDLLYSALHGGVTKLSFLHQYILSLYCIFYTVWHLIRSIIVYCKQYSRPPTAYLTNNFKIRTTFSLQPSAGLSAQMSALDSSGRCSSGLKLPALLLGLVA
ncbi:hypothetical protein CCH79_00020606 [Gambusia affinis]|uniref:Uncharacterized protein n=1 Tax=Gambusia affinis TaxID=33528 RepID=A0A315URP8_GAMAF|nr:hypothetical protein CCH79_00020606 [Gambusia affinis]